MAYVEWVGASGPIKRMPLEFDTLVVGNDTPTIKLDECGIECKPWSKEKVVVFKR